MKIKVMYFAQLREAAGMSEQTVELERPVTIGEFVRDFLDQPVFKKYKGLPFLYAINGELARLDERIVDGATLAILPPVAGG